MEDKKILLRIDTCGCLFPHNDKYAFVNMEDDSNPSSVDKKI